MTAPFFRGSWRLDFRKIGEKSFTKLWALDCWFSRTNDQLGKKGANFVTWEWDFDRNGVHMGHYFIEDYAGAKRDFAARSRLIEPQRLFSDKELGVIRNACEFALADDATLTYGDETRLRSIQEQIEILLPRNQEQEQEQEQRSEMEQTM